MSRLCADSLLEFFSDLNGQFARGAQNNRLDTLRPAATFSRMGSPKAAVLPVPGLRLAHGILFPSAVPG